MPNVTHPHQFLFASGEGASVKFDPCLYHVVRTNDKQRLIVNESDIDRCNLSLICDVADYMSTHSKTATADDIDKVHKATNLTYYICILYLIYVFNYITFNYM